MKINKSFVDNYLLDNGSVDNYLFENCGKEMIKQIYQTLETQKFKNRQCVVQIINEEEQMVHKLLDKCQNTIERSVLVREFVNSKVMRALYSGVDKSKENKCIEKLKAYYNSDIWLAKAYYKESGLMFPFDIINFVKKHGRVNINVLFDDNKSTEIQRAFNNYMSSRLPISVRFFFTKNMISCLDQSGNMIQSPHDYISVNVHNFIEEDELQ